MGTNTDFWKAVWCHIPLDEQLTETFLPMNLKEQLTAGETNSGRSRWPMLLLGVGP